MTLCLEVVSGEGEKGMGEIVGREDGEHGRYSV
jgi:hypothetical protein